MKKALKSTSTLVLIIVFLSACLVSLFLIFAASWLHTYKAFTREKTVAEISISQEMEDEFGTYAEVTVTPIDTDLTALTKIFTGDEDPNPENLDEQVFKVYGDTVYFGGPIIKFKSGFILLNFETAYKFNTVYGRYDADPELEEARPDEAFSSFNIGGKDTTYRNIANDIRDDSMRGKIFKIFFDSEPQIKTTGVFISGRAVSGELVIRNDGFHWELQEAE